MPGGLSTLHICRQPTEEVEAEQEQVREPIELVEEEGNLLLDDEGDIWEVE